MAKRKIKKNVRLDSLKATKNPRVRAELLDYDYLKKLNPEEKRWLAQFTDEYTHASIQKDSKGKVKAGHLHNTKALAKSCTDTNNWRNNDVYGVSRANNLAFDIDQQLGQSDGWYITNNNYTEDALISQIESKQQEESLGLIEYFKTRDLFIDNRKKELDKEFMGKYKLKDEHYYLLIIIFDSKITTKGKVLKMAEDINLLEKFVKNSEFFKSQKSST